MGTTGCKFIVDSYLFDLDGVVERIKRANPRLKHVYIEAPQGFVRLARRLADFLEKCLLSNDIRVEIGLKLEPVFGSCSISIDDVKYIGNDVLIVHLGHGPYAYPICIGNNCSYSAKNYLNKLVHFVPGEYIGGDPSKLASLIKELLGTNSRIAVGYSVQHESLAKQLALELSRSGYSVRAVEPVLGCYYYRLVRLENLVDAYVVVAGGYFHALGLGLALGGEGRVLRADPYSNSIEDIGGKIQGILAKRYWLFNMLRNAQRVGVIAGLLPGQYRPWIANFIESLAKKRGIYVRRIYARYVTKEYLDNLSPDDYDAFVVTSCPRLAIEDLGDYWKPVLTPAEARLWLSNRIGSERYTFPW
ncbi:diphthamide biosynthesis enzyme Dph2 [Pyrofollis japonicus]|uniref:2-(3-amino-3-carboxypropyl)histidine synthase subunit 1/2 n=1 Tax=Pyrofollis japonicus TaxID=3060460 RepID=UPI00295B48D6|nr:2-(3-amino-3-carboxypropyl)histidine synthase subunit 1/2 [Pyrofollis japonicus]BEP18119.1 diphthamide biosynthesis enzyme Dph2 [Pyrofollis japonicus]